MSTMPTAPVLPTAPALLGSRSPAVPNRALERELATIRSRPGPSITEGIEAARDLNWIAPTAFSHISQLLTEADPTFQVTEDLLKNKAGNLPTEYLDGLGDASSMAEFDLMIADRARKFEARQTLEQMGWTGTAAGVMMSILDPVALAATAATSGLAAPWVYGGTATRLSVAIRLGLVEAAQNASIEGYLTARDPGKSPWDVVIAAGAGAAFGAGAGAISAGTAKAAGKFRKAGELGELSESGAAITEKGRAYYVQTSPVADEIEQAFAERLGTQADGIIDQVPEPEGPRRALGATTRNMKPARGGPIEPKLDIGDSKVFNFGEADGAYKANVKGINKIRLATAPVNTTMGISPSRTERLLGEIGVQDAILRESDRPVTYAATEQIGDLWQSMVARGVGGIDQAFTAFRREAGAQATSLRQKLQMRRNFEREVADTIRSGIPSSSPHINSAVTSVRAILKENLEIAQKNGVKGADRVLSDPRYLPVQFVAEQIDGAVSEYGQATLGKFLGEAIRREAPELTAEQAQRLGTGYLNNILQIRSGRTDSAAAMLDGAAAEVLEKSVREAFSEYTPEALDDLLTKILPDSKAGATGPLKKSILLDRSYTAQIVNKAGEVKTLAFADLIDNNVSRVVSTYSRRMVGAAAESAMLDHMSRTLGERFTSASEVIARIRKEYAESGLTTGGVFGIDGRVKRIENLFRAIRGQPIGESWATNIIRGVRDLNYLRLGGSFGVTAALEAGQIFAQGGLSAIRQAVPMANAIVRKITGGHSDSDQLARELMTMFGAGQGRRLARMGEDMLTTGFQTESGGGLVGKGLRKLRNFTADITAVAPVTDASERFAGRAAAQRWYDDAVKGVVRSDRRYRSMGVLPGDVDRIHKMLIKHGDASGPLGTLKGLNIGDWEDVEAAAMFRVAVSKWSRQVIQRADYGELANWMHGDIGRLLVQFRNFPIVALQKQALFNINVRDMQAINSLAYGTFAGAMGYVAMQHLNLLGDPDREAKLEDRLAWDKIGKAAFSRSSWSSLLPSVVDLASTSIGEEGALSGFRSTGLENDPVLGSPALSMYQAAKGLPGAARSMVDRNYDFSQADMRALRAVLPWQNLPWGVRQWLDGINRDLPRESQPRN